MNFKEKILNLELSKIGILADFSAGSIYFIKVNDSFVDTSILVKSKIFTENMKQFHIDNMDDPYSFRILNENLPNFFTENMKQFHIDNIHDRDSFRILKENLPNFDSKSYLISWLQNKNFKENLYINASINQLQSLIEEYVDKLNHSTTNKLKKNAIKFFKKNIKNFSKISDLIEVNDNNTLLKITNLKDWFKSKNFKDNVYTTDKIEKLRVLKKTYYEKLQKSKENSSTPEKWFTKNLNNLDELIKDLGEVDIVEDSKESEDELEITEDQVMGIQTKIINKINEGLHLSCEALNLSCEALNLSCNEADYKFIHDNILNYMLFAKKESVLTVNTLIVKIISESDPSKYCKYLKKEIKTFITKKYIKMKEEDKKLTFNKLKLFDTIIKLSFHKYTEGQNNHIHLQYLEKNNKGHKNRKCINDENYKIKYYLKYNFDSNENFNYNLVEILDSEKDNIGPIYKILLEKNIEEFNNKIKECIMNNIFTDDSIQKEDDTTETLDSRLEQTLTDEGQKLDPKNSSLEQPLIDEGHKLDPQNSSMEHKNAEYEASQHKVVKKEE